MPSQRSQWFARNEKAEDLEADGKRADALALYEQNAREGCTLSFTYERMAAIYRAEDRLPEAVEAIEKAFEIEKNRGPSAKVVRLQESVKRLRRAATDAGPRRAQVPSRERAKGPSTLPKSKGKATSKGCFSVIALLLSVATLTLTLL